MTLEVGGAGTGAPLIPDDELITELGAPLSCAWCARTATALASCTYTGTRVWSACPAHRVGGPGHHVTVGALPEHIMQAVRHAYRLGVLARRPVDAPCLRITPSPDAAVLPAVELINDAGDVLVVLQPTTRWLDGALRYQPVPVPPTTTEES